MARTTEELHIDRLRRCVQAVTYVAPVAPPPPKCAECGDTGEVLDAPGSVLDGHPYWAPCPECSNG